jgi:hypothetical protein
MQCEKHKKAARGEKGSAKVTSFFLLLQEANQIMLH